MSRLLSPDDKCIQVDVRGHRYTGKSLEVTNPADARLLKAAGYTSGSVSGAPTRSGGYKCAACGFSSFFKVCGRCGGSCQRPD